MELRFIFIFLMLIFFPISFSLHASIIDYTSQDFTVKSQQIRSAFLNSKNGGKKNLDDIFLEDTIKILTPDMTDHHYVKIVQSLIPLSDRQRKNFTSRWKKKFGATFIHYQQKALIGYFASWSRKELDDLFKSYNALISPEASRYERYKLLEDLYSLGPKQVFSIPKLILPILQNSELFFKREILQACKSINEKQRKRVILFIKKNFENLTPQKLNNLIQTCQGIEPTNWDNLLTHIRAAKKTYGDHISESTILQTLKLLSTRNREALMQSMQNLPQDMINDRLFAHLAKKMTEMTFDYWLNLLNNIKEIHQMIETSPVLSSIQTSQLRASPLEQQWIQGIEVLSRHSLTVQSQLIEKARNTHKLHRGAFNPLQYLYFLNSIPSTLWDEITNLIHRGLNEAKTEHEQVEIYTLLTTNRYFQFYSRSVIEEIQDIFNTHIASQERLEALKNFFMRIYDLNEYSQYGNNENVMNKKKISRTFLAIEKIYELIPVLDKSTDEVISEANDYLESLLPTANETFPRTALASNEVENALRTLKGPYIHPLDKPAIVEDESYTFLKNGQHVTMKGLFARTWQLIQKHESVEKDIDTKTVKEFLLKNLVKNLGQCIEDDNHRVCNIGISERLVVTLQGHIPGIIFDDELLPTVNAFTAQFLLGKNEEIKKKQEASLKDRMQYSVTMVQEGLDLANKLYGENSSESQTIHQDLQKLCELEFDVQLR